MTLDEALAIAHYYDAGECRRWAIGPEYRVLSSAKDTIRYFAEEAIKREIEVLALKEVER